MKIKLQESVGVKI